MEAKTPDAVEFRDGQRKQWNSAATGWRKWSELIDGAASGISKRLVELAGVEPGSRVLDVAAGYGEPSLSAARTAGADGRVVATDISAEMLAFGRERAAAAGLLGIAGPCAVPGGSPADRDAATQRRAAAAGNARSALAPDAGRPGRPAGDGGLLRGRGGGGRG